VRFADLVSLYFQQSNMLQTYWTVYVVAIGGLLAVAALRRDPDRPAAIFATVLYLAFAYKNCSAIMEVTQMRQATYATITRYDTMGTSDNEQTAIRSFQKEVTPTLVVTDPAGVKRFHTAIDVLVIITLWLLQLRRRLAYRERMRLMAEGKTVV
jgi:hypothetical protein